MMKGLIVMNYKNYIGTKRVEAKPMTRGEYNKYRGWTIPADENPADEGYLVKYNDGYITWSPKKQFEEAYSEIGEKPLVDSVLLMKSSDFKDRFKAEYYQLVLRADGLEKMLEKYKSGTLAFTPNSSYELLYEQLVYMKNYMEVLEKRAELESIELL